MGPVEARQLCLGCAAVAIAHVTQAGPGATSPRALGKAGPAMDWAQSRQRNTMHSARPSDKVRDCYCNYLIILLHATDSRG